MAMSELGTKDVLEQVDARLGNVEQDIRSLRTEMNDRFADVNIVLTGLKVSWTPRPAGWWDSFC